jgi:hypothetical protein
MRDGTVAPHLLPSTEEAVKVLYAIVCEAAQMRDDGRVDAHGIFHQLYAPGFPARQDDVTLAVTVEWEPHERGAVQFSIDLLDPARSPVMTIRGESEVRDFGALHGPPLTRLLLPMESVYFPAAGTYTFEMGVGEQRFPLATLHLIENPAAG